MRNDGNGQLADCQDFYTMTAKSEKRTFSFECLLQMIRHYSHYIND